VVLLKEKGEVFPGVFTALREALARVSALKLVPGPEVKTSFRV
jgi:hypothetical protein